jgi:hypothetical protein
VVSPLRSPQMAPEINLISKNAQLSIADAPTVASD